MNTDKEVQINLSIRPTWSILQDVKNAVSDLMNSKKYKVEHIDASIMCASELVENSIKYGSSEIDSNSIMFNLMLHDNKIVIKVSNGIKDVNDLDNVKSHIEKLKQSDDPSSLYIERLKQLMVSRKQGESQLGLYRISYEGEFKLDYLFNDKILTIIATRDIT